MNQEPGARGQDSDPGLPLQSPLFKALWLPLAKFCAWLLFMVCGPVRTFGKYRIPKTGGLLILANHRADVDPALVQVACPRSVYFMAKSELFTMPVLGAFIKAFKAFPVKRGEPDKASIKKAVSYLKAGQAVCVFPEGELSETGEMLPLKPGVALIVRMAQVPVICVGLKSTALMLPYGKLIPRPAFRWIEARWGEIHNFAPHEEAASILSWVDAQLRSLTE